MVGYGFGLSLAVDLSVLRKRYCVHNLVFVKKITQNTLVRFQRGFEILAQNVSEDLPKGLRPHSTEFTINKLRPSPLFFIIKTCFPIKSYK